VTITFSGCLQNQVHEAELNYAVAVRFVAALLNALLMAFAKVPAKRLLIVPEQVRSCFGATTAPRCAGNVAECPTN
jgi:hypothetical protein